MKQADDDGGVERPFRCHLHLHDSRRLSSDTDIHTYVMALSELGACLEVWSFPPSTHTAGLFKACLDLDIPFQNDGKVLIEHLVTCGLKQHSWLRSSGKEPLYTLLR